MARILLLDDSPTMHRVVRLTFADDQRLEIAVARNRGEADQNLGAQKADLIIAYVRFDGLTEPHYFESLRYASPRILLLAESEENLDQFTRSGFGHILKKPFHSDELRQVVEEMLSKEFSITLEPTQAMQSSPSARPVPPAPPSPPPAPPAAPATASPSARPVPPAPPPAPPSAPPAPHAALEARAQPPKSVPPAPISQPPASQAVELALGSGQSQNSAGEPLVTMDLSFFKQESEQTKATNSAKSQSHQFSIPPLSGMPSASMAPVFDTAADSQFERPPPSFPPVEAFIPQSEPPKKTFSAPPQRVEPRTVQAAASVPSAAGAAAPPQNSVPPPRLSGHSRLPLNGIEPAAPTNEPFDIEDVMVSTKYLQSPAQVHGGEYRSGSSTQTQTVKVVERVGLSRQEVEKIVEETLAVAVDRAVRQALTEVIPDLRQTLVIEVSQRAVDQLSEELMVIKKTLREQMVAEIRDVSSQWLRKETPSIAKDVIREEIRRVIEQI